MPEFVIGILLPYGGTNASSLESVGFLFCDGNPISRKNYTQLFDIIGTVHGGGDGTNTFNKPDYRGRFLRGVDCGTNRDPNANHRTEANPGGLTGDNIGSVQLDDSKEHAHTVSTNPLDTGSTEGIDVFISGDEGNFTNTSTQTITSSTAGGSESESRPKNANVDWIINFSEIDDGLLVGMIISFAGKTEPMDLEKKGWFLCDGSTKSRHDDSTLFDIIGTVHGGGDGTYTYNLPDYRGRFLRGVDHGQRRDPDAADRTAANPGGLTGDQVGSVQEDAFPHHTHSLKGPTKYPDKWGGMFNGTNFVFSNETSSTAGESSETRPKNLCLDFYIAYTSSGSIPVGAVLPFAGVISQQNINYLKSNGWLYCDGNALSRKDPEYEELFADIGTIHGAGDGKTTFNLPDYRGRFIRGVDHGIKRDPNAQSRIAANKGGQTGDAIGSLQDEALTLHTHDFDIGHKGDGKFKFSSDASCRAKTTNLTASTFGNDENRPKNAYVNFVIKYKSK